MTVDSRLDILERSNRRLKAGFLACLCCIVTVFLVAATSSPRIIDVQKIVLRDIAGNERGELFANDDAWGLVLFNKNKTKAASMAVMAEANGILLSDPNGNIRQGFTSDLNQSDWSIFRPGSDSAQFTVTDNAEGTGLGIRDRANRDRVSLGVSPQGGSGLKLDDANGTTRALVFGNDAGFALISSKGTLEWSPSWEKLTPDEKEQLKSLVPKFRPGR
jgi:hypothetical protein